MSWQTPKTDWREQDAYLAADDGRIRGNAAYLRDWANRVCAPMDDGPLGQYSETDVLTVSAYNAVENAVAAVCEEVGPADYAPRALTAGGPVWDAADLRRLEGACAQANRRLRSGELCRPSLHFTLGGEGFDAKL